MNKEQNKKIYSEYDLDIKILEALDEQRIRHHAILEYLLNKHSKSINEGGLDYIKAFEEIEDYEQYLLN